MKQFHLTRYVTPSAVKLHVSLIRLTPETNTLAAERISRHASGVICKLLGESLAKTK